MLSRLPLSPNHRTTQAHQSPPTDPLKMSVIPNNGTCFLTNTTGEFLSNVYGCSPGFYCPFSNASIPESLPQFCIPSPLCQLARLQSFPCPAQGAYEPTVCPPGRYCPDYRFRLPCPKGYFCPTGTVTPIKCSTLSSCPEKSTSQTYYGGLVICAILDVILVILILLVKRMEALKRVKTLGKRKDELPLADDYHDQKTENYLLRAFSKGFNFQKLSMRFTFENMSYTQGKGDKAKTIIQNVNGCIRPGRLTAIMGPSGYLNLILGAGKTSFMSVLMGKVKRTSGKLF